jgi:hypothetical protein
MHAVPSLTVPVSVAWVGELDGRRRVRFAFQNPTHNVRAKLLIYLLHTYMPSK